MHFIDDIHLVSATRRSVLGVIDNFPHIINTGIGCRIHFNQVNKTAVIDIHARRTLTTWLGTHTYIAIQAFGQNAGNRGFAHTACTGKQIRMMQAIVVKRIDQRLQHMLLPHHFAKKPWSPLSG
jgi:hypothetical protein